MKTSIFAKWLIVLLAAVTLSGCIVDGPGHGWGDGRHDEGRGDHDHDHDRDH